MVNSSSKNTVSSQKYRIAIVGGSGLVGKELIEILKERKFPIESCRIFGSENSRGEKVSLLEHEIIIEELSDNSFDDAHIVFFATSEAMSKQYIPLAVSKGAICIDKSSAYRLDEAVPLIVPEVNIQTLIKAKTNKIISVPNCTTTPIAQILAPLDKLFEIKRVVVCTYQAVSGAGRDGFKELETQVRDLLNFREIQSDIFKQRIAFNVLPAIPTDDIHVHSGATSEERKIVDELPKILGKKMRISATCARVPVFNGHSAALHIEFNNAVSLEDAKNALRKTKNVELIDRDHHFGLPTVEHANGKDITLVGRVRLDESVDHGLVLWLACDNLRTGAALTAVRIAEQLPGVLL